MADAEKRMGRGELAQQLQKWALALKEAAADEDGESVVRLSSGAFDVLCERLCSAAAALEEEGRDARRWRAFASFYSKEKWFRVTSSQYSPYIEMRSEYHPENEAELEQLGFRNTIGAAIDDWINKHASML